MKIKFEWSFEETDLVQANESTVEDDIYGFVYPSTAKGNYIVDIHKEYYSASDCGFDLEVYTEVEGGGHGEWLGSIHNIRSAKVLKRFKSRAEKLLTRFIEEEEGE